MSRIPRLAAFVGLLLAASSTVAQPAPQTPVSRVQLFPDRARVTHGPFSCDSQRVGLKLRKTADLDPAALLRSLVVRSSPDCGEALGFDVQTAETKVDGVIWLDVTVTPSPATQPFTVSYETPQAGWSAVYHVVLPGKPDDCGCSGRLEGQAVLRNDTEYHWVAGTTTVSLADAAGAVLAQSDKLKVAVVPLHGTATVNWPVPVPVAVPRYTVTSGSLPVTDQPKTFALRLDLKHDWPKAFKTPGPVEIWSGSRRLRSITDLAQFPPAKTADAWVDFGKLDSVQAWKSVFDFSEVLAVKDGRVVERRWQETRHEFRNSGPECRLFRLTFDLDPNRRYERFASVPDKAAKDVTKAAEQNRRRVWEFDLAGTDDEPSKLTLTVTERLPGVRSLDLTLPLVAKAEDVRKLRDQVEQRRANVGVRAGGDGVAQTLACVAAELVDLETTLSALEAQATVLRRQFLAVAFPDEDSGACRRPEFVVFGLQAELDCVRGEVRAAVARYNTTATALRAQANCEPTVPVHSPTVEHAPSPAESVPTPLPVDSPPKPQAAAVSEETEVPPPDTKADGPLLLPQAPVAAGH